MPFNNDSLEDVESWFATGMGAEDGSHPRGSRTMALRRLAEVPNTRIRVFVVAEVEVPEKQASGAGNRINPGSLVRFNCRNAQGFSGALIVPSL